MALKCPECMKIDREQEPKIIKVAGQRKEHWQCKRCGSHWDRDVGSNKPWR